MGLISNCKYCGKSFSFLDWLSGVKSKHVSACEIAERAKEKYKQASKEASTQRYYYPKRVERPAVSNMQASSMASGALMGGAVGVVAGLAVASLLDESTPEYSSDCYLDD